MNNGTEMYILSTLLIWPGEIPVLESVAKTLFTMDKHAIANVFF